MNLPLNIDLQQILLHALNFVILFAALYFLLYKPVKKFMDAREQKYKDMSDEAGKKLGEADRAVAELEEKLNGMSAEAEKQRTAILAGAQEQAAKRIGEANDEARKIVEQARDEAAAIRRKAVSDAEEDISRLAAESVGKAVMESAGKAFDTFLDAIEKEGKNG